MGGKVRRTALDGQHVRFSIGSAFPSICCLVRHPANEDKLSWLDTFSYGHSLLLLLLLFQASTRRGTIRQLQLVEVYRRSRNSKEYELIGLYVLSAGTIFARDLV